MKVGYKATSLPELTGIWWKRWARHYGVTLRRPETPMPWTSWDQTPCWFNNTALDRSYAPRGYKPTVREIEHHSRQRFTICSIVDSAATSSPSPALSSLRLRAKHLDRCFQKGSCYEPTSRSAMSQLPCLRAQCICQFTFDLYFERASASSNTAGKKMPSQAHFRSNRHSPDDR